MARTFNYLSVDDPNHDNHTLRETDVVGYARLNLDSAQELFFRGRTSYQDYSKGDSFYSHQTRDHSDVEQLYYRFDLEHYLAAYKGEETPNDLSVELGRQTIIWGNGLAFNQDLDAAVVDFVNGPFTAELLAGRTVRDTIDFDTSRPGFNSKTDRIFYGGLVTEQLDRNKPFAYVLVQRDDNPNTPYTLPLANGQDITTHFDYNSVYAGLGSTGSIGDKMVYGLEGVFEGGDTLSNSYTLLPGGGIAQATQTHNRIEAYAVDGRLDYVFNDPHDTRASAEMILASGDHNRGVTNTTFNGSKPGTDDMAFNGMGLLNTGLAFSPEVSNVMVERVGISTQPFNQNDFFRKLELGADFFVYEKFLEHAPIDEPTTAGGFLGTEPDVFLNWQLTSDLTLAMRYGIFSPSHLITSSSKDRQLFFTGVTFAF
jgi:hypothetical protein